MTKAITHDRKREILMIAVDDYIRTAQPITSARVQVHFPNLSTATLRNELNALDSMGYFKQLHTSSGRVPTDDAYKQYVNEILAKNDLDFSKLAQVQEGYETKSKSLMTTLTLLAKKLSSVTNYPTVLMQYGFENLEIVNIQIIPLMAKDALLLIETQSGIIDDNIALGDIDRRACQDASEYLTQHFAGHTIKFMVDNMKEMALRAGSQMLAFNALIDSVIKAVKKVVAKKVDVSASHPAKMLSNITQDEYDDAREIMDFLSDGERVMSALDTQSSDVNCRVGEDDLKHGMMLTAPITINGVTIASLSLVGPKRVDYAMLASALKFIVSQADDLK